MEVTKINFKRITRIFIATLLLAVFLPLQVLAANLSHVNKKDNVKSAQQNLMHIVYSLSTLNADFFASTTKAIIFFQKSKELKTNSISKKNSQETLNSIGANPATITDDTTISKSDSTNTNTLDTVKNETNITISSDTTEAVSVPTTTLKLAMNSDDVLKLQNRLKELKYFSSACTGYYGTITKDAIMSFQRVNGLKIDGVANSQTLEILFGTSAQAKPIQPAPPQTVPSLDVSSQDISSQNDDNASIGDQIVSFAKTLLGKRYVRGTIGPKTFDCSGLAYYVYKNFGYTLPRTAYDQGYDNYGTKITSIDDLKPGDLVFFNTISDKDLSDHVGIYIGNYEFINAENSKSGVVISDMSKGCFKILFSWGRRVFN